MGESKYRKDLTNLEFCELLTIADIGWVNRVAREYIDKRVGKHAPIEFRERVFYEWCAADFDKESWDRARPNREERRFRN